jgi:hypothetical protein
LDRHPTTLLAVQGGCGDLLKKRTSVAEMFRMGRMSWVVWPLIGSEAAGASRGGMGVGSRLGRALSSRIPAGRSERVALLGLAVILVLGAVLRVLLMFAWGPAFMGYPDTVAPTVVDSAYE